LWRFPEICWNDALGCGFGATIQIGDKIVYEYRQRTTEVTGTKLSNWQELNNLGETLERVVVSHNLQGSEIFISTDNTTAEATFLEGTSWFCG
jgi:hypothetical protein